MSINRSTPKNGTSPISYGRPAWNPRCCFVCSLWISTLRSPAKQSAVIFSFALAWEKKTPGQTRQKCTAVRFSGGNLFETFRRGTFRRAAASSLDTSFFNFRFFFNSDLDATQGSNSSSIFLDPVGALSHKNVLYDDIGKTVKAKWNLVKLELYKFILDIFVANCWFSNFLTQK